MRLPIGCFLVRTGDQTVLVDAGLGPRDLGWLVGGDLPVGTRRARRRAGRHRHRRVHATSTSTMPAGWSQDDVPFFPNATVRFGDGDWHTWVDDAHPKDRIRKAMLLLDEQQRLDPIDGDDVSIAPGHHRAGRTRATRWATTSWCCPPAPIVCSSSATR